MKDDKYLNDKELLEIYGINNPDINLGNKYNQQRALYEVKYGGYETNKNHIIKNPYVRYGVMVLIILAFIVVSAMLFHWIFHVLSDGLMSYERYI